MSPTKKKQESVLVDQIEPRILLIRGQKVILDADLAELYGVTMKVFSSVIKRNSDRFPDDFRFRLTADERQEAVADCDHLTRLKFSRPLPFAFTERGTIMAASVLSTPRAIDVSTYVVRAFVKLRELVSTHRQLASKLETLDRHVAGYDKEIQSLLIVIRQLTAPPAAGK